jgi:hypothetical protein
MSPPTTAEGGVEIFAFVGAARAPNAPERQRDEHDAAHE